MAQYRGHVSHRGQREIEAAFVVASSDPAAVFARLRELRMLGPYGLASRPVQRLHDRYLDTPSRDLWRRRLAFRERHVDGERRLAVKGEIGPRERLEIEEISEEGARTRMEGELRARGVQTTLAALAVIQERDTVRERRALSSRGRVVAELALDEVNYRLGARGVRLHEVEVELEDLDAELDPLVLELQGAAPELREWPYNKLATGAALATALERGALGLGPAGTLDADALDQLARRLAASGGSAGPRSGVASRDEPGDVF